ncbi:MAG TPA: hypothetical protein VNM22_10675 [Candidatus Limnocylindrales bacterium]|nr:hypothetical protein [Candidatus Limnocylindrales bacterium]
MRKTVLYYRLFQRERKDQVGKWLNKSHAYSLKGLYTLQGIPIQFVVENSSGKIEYEGNIQGDTLNLNWYSYINGHRGISTYTFTTVSLSVSYEHTVAATPERIQELLLKY